MFKPPFDDQCSELRQRLKVVGGDLMLLKRELTPGGAFHQNVPKEADVNEMIANLMLSFRHIEDATMRLGKAIQAFDGGKSVYDK